ncbi:MAG: signal peptidase II [Clostridiaceae bacterium]|nr:signal peptidase II [Clostridiaceae bacterium]
MLYLLIILLVIIDQTIKQIIIRNVGLQESIPVIDGFFSITHVKNTGGAFSFLSDQGWGIYFLASMSLVISMILIVVIFKLRNKNMFWIRLAATVLASGSIGNMIDRFAYQSVVDFLMFDFGRFTFPIFNFADMCIVVGSFSLAILLLFDRRFMKDSDTSNEDGPDDRKSDADGPDIETTTSDEVL